ncbi:hypothetical protein [Streptomyces sp. NBC_01429]|uniref:hypothetical protein n=1 Tax=Streptomyces sp. NBC_01429 TaxID=2903862 RepID=UPI002E29919F|nr:hypothetical protein [Streptomyces sp. NBC_01429]
MSDYFHNQERRTDEILRRATALIGQAVTLRLSNGDDLTGTLTGFSGQPSGWPAGASTPRDAIVVEDADDKSWTIHPNAVLAIAG